jgi:para-nitrobenzyl esterase
MSEHCLFLNVYAPRDHFESHAAQILPVVIYIHGGAFTFGSGSPKLLNPSVYTEHNVLLVSINYRLNLLGFLALPNLPFTNFGLLDQRIAMEWVRINIAAFGGDSKQVTLIGDSAGAISILHHLTSPLHRRDPLFNRGILLSAGIFAGKEFTLATAQRQGLKLAGMMGCPTTPKEALDCLLKLPATSVKVQTTRFPTPFVAAFPMEQRLTGYPLNDRTFFPDLLESLQNGDFDRSIPLIIGSDLNEGSMFAAAAFPVIYPNERLYDSIISKLFGSDAALVKERYHPDKYGGVRGAVNELTSHLFTSQGTCQAARLVSQFADQRGGVYRYGNYHLFTHHPNEPLGVYHTASHFLFLRPTDTGLLTPQNYTRDELELSRRLGDLFLSFARGEPLESKGWPKFDTKDWNELHIGFNNSFKLAIGQGFQREDCDFFAKLYPPTGLEVPMFRGDLYDDEDLLPWLINHTFWIIAMNLRLFVSAFGAVLVGSLLIAYWCCCFPYRTKRGKDKTEKIAKIAAGVNEKMKKD